MEIKVLEKLSNKKFNAKKDYAFSFVKYLAKEFKLQGEVLDIGAGRGEYSKPFESVGLNYQGIDAEPEIDSIHKCDITKEEIPFSDDSFDVVFMRYVIEHINKGEDTTHTLDEIKRVLKPGGLLVLVTSDWIRKYKTFYDAFDHVSPYTQNSTRRLLEYHCFKTMICRDYINIPFLWKYFPVLSFKYRLKRNGIIYIGKNNKKVP